VREPGLRGVGARAAILLLALASASARAEEASPDPLEGALRARVEHLAGTAYSGRGAWEDRERAAAWIATAFEEAGLRPVPGREGWYQDHGGAEGEPRSRNVLGWWAAAPDAPHAGEHVVLSAHYDHLGVQDGRVYPGADDNASGVAVLLELARRLAGAPGAKPPRRAVLFVAFDLEERGLVGSRRYAADPAVPLDRCAAFLTMDQMGRSLGDLAPGTLFLMGSEHSEVLADLVAGAPEPEGGAKAVLGIDFQPPLGSSDYEPFREREVPFVFVSTGSCAHWHDPGDTPDRLDYAGMAVRTRWMEAFVRRLLEAERPVWREPPAPELGEIRTVLRLVGAARERLDATPGVPAFLATALRGYATYLEGIVERGAVTPRERTSVRTTAHMLFQQAVTLLR
jgi:hypothetical protein